MLSRKGVRGEALFGIQRAVSPEKLLRIVLIAEIVNLWYNSILTNPFGGVLFVLTYDAVIFDLDGTLTDSRPGIFACTVYALKKMGLPVPPEATLSRFLGPPLAESFMKYCGMTEEQAAYATDLYRERYIPIGWKENSVYPRIRALLAALKERGAYLAVATGKPEHTSVDILRYFDLLRYFDAVAGPTPQDLHADKGTLIRRVLPEGRKAVMIGDIAGDIKGAQDAGIDSAAALYGYGKRAETLAQRPTHAAETTQALCELLCPDMPAPKGCVIAFEGESAQREALKERLTQFGYSVRRAQARDGRDVILPAVNHGEIVLCDRHVGNVPGVVFRVSAAQTPEEGTEEAFRKLLGQMTGEGVL